MFKAFSPLLSSVLFSVTVHALAGNTAPREKHPVGSAWLPAVQRVYLPSFQDKKAETSPAVITSSTGSIKPVIVPQQPPKHEPLAHEPRPPHSQPTPEEMHHILSQLQAVLDMPDDEEGEDDQDFYLMPEEEEKAFEAFLSALQQEQKKPAPHFY